MAPLVSARARIAALAILLSGLELTTVALSSQFASPAAPEPSRSESFKITPTAAPAVPATAPKPLPEGTLFVRPHTSEPGTMMLFWNGKIIPTMSNQIWTAFEANRAKSGRFVLVLNSGGGFVKEGEAVIATLRRIQTTHRLDTEVRNGQTCGSMCVFVFLQGQGRAAAPSSTWLFHEITRPDPTDSNRQLIDRQAWDRLIERYYKAAGVSVPWTDQMKPKTVNADYWQTGYELVQSRTGIVTAPLSNIQPRVLTTNAATQAKPQAAGK